MPEDNPAIGVKDGSEVSPAPETHTMTVEPPAESTSVQPKVEKAENHIPYPRFKEVNEKAKSLEAEVAKLRGELASHKEVPAVTNDEPEIDDMGKWASRLEEKGIDPKNSKVLAEVMKDIAKAEAKDRVMKENAKSEATRKAAAEEEKGRAARATEDIQKWQTEFKAKHADYADLEPEMQKKWESLDKEAQRALVASPTAFALLYDSAKAAKASSELSAAESEGRNSAYETQRLKSAVSSTPGATANPGKKFTADDVSHMSVKEYKANREKVLSDLGLKK